MSEGSIRWVDETTKPIPTADTWDNLSINQLLEVQIQLQERQFQFRNNEAIKKALTPAIARLEHLISQKLNEN